MPLIHEDADITPALLRTLSIEQLKAEGIDGLWIHEVNIEAMDETISDAHAVLTRAAGALAVAVAEKPTWIKEMILTARAVLGEVEEQLQALDEQYSADVDRYEAFSGKGLTTAELAPLKAIGTRIGALRATLQFAPHLSAELTPLIAAADAEGQAMADRLDWFWPLPLPASE